jgi:hypothetical protein
LYVVVDAAGAVSVARKFSCARQRHDTQWIDGQLFGLTSLAPAVFIDASRDEFDPRMDDYLVWRISHSQRPLVRIRLHRSMPR